MIRVGTWSGLLVLVFSSAVPIGAAWLVTSDGARIETAGTWSIRGETVVFTTRTGVLSSMRTSEIDLDATRRLAASEIPVRVVPLEPLPPKPVLVLTDREIARGRDIGESGARPSSVEERYEGDDMVVDRWTRTRRDEFDGFEIVGELRNASAHALRGLGMQVVVFDAHGARLAIGEAFLLATALDAGERGEFRVVLSDVNDFAVIRFQPFGVMDGLD